MQHTARRTNGILHRGMHDYYNVQKRGKKDMGRYKNLIDEQLVKGWDNLPRGKFSRKWKQQQRAYKTRQQLKDPVKYDGMKRQKKRQQETQQQRCHGGGGATLKDTQEKNWVAFSSTRVYITN